MWTLLATRLLQTFSTANVTFFIDPVDSGRSRTTNENRAQVRVPVDGTLRNLRAYVSANARTSGSTIKLRKNGADGLMNVSIGAGATGNFEDTVNTDTVVEGDLINFALVHGSGSAVLTLLLIQLEFVAGDGSSTYVYCYVGNDGVAGFNNATRYSAIGGYGRTVLNAWGGSIGTERQTAIGADATAFNPRAFIVANSLDAAAEFELYINGSASGLKITVGAGVTGEVVNTTDTAAITAGDALSWRYSSGSTSGTLTLGHLEIAFRDTGDEQWCITVTRAENANPLITAPATRYSYPFGAMDYSSGLSTGLKVFDDVQAINVYANSGQNFTTGTVTLRTNTVATSASVAVTAPNNIFGGGVQEGLDGGDLLDIDVTMTTGTNSFLANSVTSTFGPPSADVIASGPLATVTVTAPAGTADTSVEASGAIGTVAVTPPEGGPVSDAVASGPLATVAVTPPRITTNRATQAGAIVSAVAENELNTTQAGLGAVAEVQANGRVTQMGLLVIAKGGETPLVPDPLKLQDGGRDKLLTQRLVNMYVETTPEGPVQTARFQRPGLYSVAEYGGGPVRATFIWKGFRFTVSGGLVWRDAVNIGTVPEDGECRWAISDEEIVVVAGNRAYYVTLESVSRILDPDLPFVRDVIFLAGRFVYFDADTGGFYRYSKVNDARSIDGLAFASAEGNPDRIIGSAVQGEAMAIFGEITTEWHFPTLDPDNPFQRSQGRTYDKGCRAIATVQLADNNLHFQGSDRIIYRASQVPLRVSNHDVENQLRKQTEEQFAQNSAFVVVFGGHTFYVLNIVGYGTWALNVAQKLWAEWKSWGKDRFRVSVCDVDGFMGDYYTGRIMGFDGKKMVDLDADPIERIVSTWQPLKSGMMRNFSLALHCQQGVGLFGVEDAEGGDPKVEMRFSDHLGENWTNWMEGNLGKHGVRGKEALAQWTNLGTFPSPGRAFEFRCTGPIEFTPFMVSINEWRP